MRSPQRLAPPGVLSLLLLSLCLRKHRLIMESEMTGFKRDASPLTTSRLRSLTSQQISTSMLLKPNMDSYLQLLT